ncbi:MAG: SPOR domain-containing protein [Methyloceanibacter sp.]
MAVHRKRPLPRDPTLGKRLGRCVIAAGGLLAVAGLGLMGPAQAQEGDSASLSSGAAAFSAGKYDSAVTQLSAALRSDRISPANAANALYLRGLAYQKQGEPSRAIADLGAALWLGLSSSERVQAMVNRSLAYRAAGLKSEADKELSLARKEDKNREVDRLLAEGGGSAGGSAAIAAFSTEVHEEQSGRTSTIAARPLNSAASPSPSASPARSADASSAESWSTTSPEAPSSGNRLSRWWGSVRGSSSEPEPPPPPAETSQKPPAVSSSWTTQTQAAPPETRVATASPSAPVPAAGGDYKLQLSPTRSEQEAKALWQKVAKENRQLASIQPRIERTDMGDLGTFYRLQIGPFQDKAESLKVCNALKRSGVDCFLITP